MEYSRRPTKSIPKENELKTLNKIYQTHLVSTTPSKYKRCDGRATGSKHKA